MLETLRDNAAKDVNDMFRHLKSQVSLPSTPLTAIDLLFDMVKVLLSRNDTRTLIDILVTKGSISTRDPLKAPLSMLKQKGILRKQERNHKEEYVVTERYQYPLRMLQEHGNITHLTIRNRRRPPRGS